MMSSAHTDVDSNTSTRPFWMPPGADLEELPEGLRAVIEGVLSPAYEKLVLGAQPGLEQSTGITVVGMLWLELLEYFELGRHSSSEAPIPTQEEREESMARLLRVAGAKLKASEFLLRLAEAQRRWAKESGLPGPASSSGGRVGR